MATFLIVSLVIVNIPIIVAANISCLHVNFNKEISLVLAFE